MKLIATILAALSLIACQSAKKSPDPEVEAAKNAPPTGPEIIIETTHGTIRAKLHQDTAPITVKNFLTYIDQKFYDNTIFHRVISNFMIQGGGFAIQNDIPKEKPTRSGIKNESPKTRSNTRGTLAMARTQDPDSATAQFFINTSNNDGTGPVTNLNYPASSGHGYAVFGEVIEGMDVVDKIKDLPTHSTSALSLGPNGRYTVNSFSDVPIDPIIIKSIRRADSTQ